MRQSASVFDALNARNDSNAKTRIAEVYKLVAASILAAIVGVYVGQGIAANIVQYFWGYVILEFALLFGLMYTRESFPLNMILMFGFTFMTGFTMAPMIGVYLSSAAGTETLTTALLATTASVTGLSFFAMFTKKDFTVYSQIMFMALIGLVVVSLANLFFQNSFVHMLTAYAGSIIFSIFLIIDTQRLVSGKYDSAILIAVSIYLDILNIFLSLLSILSNRD